MDEASEWRYASGREIGHDWYLKQYDDSAWHAYTPPAPIAKRWSVAFRKWFEVSNVTGITGVEVKVRHAGEVIITLNEQSGTDVWVSSDKAWMTVTLPASRLVAGRNLIAVAVNPDMYPLDEDGNESVTEGGNEGGNESVTEGGNESGNKSGNESVTESVNEGGNEGATDTITGDATNTPTHTRHGQPGYFFRCVLRLIRETEVAARAIDARASASFVRPYSPANLLSDSFTSCWLAEFSSREISVSFVFQFNSQHSINKYCVTNGADSPDLDPSAWTLHFTTNYRTQKVVLADSQSFVPWSGRLQTQCFLLPTTHNSIVSVFWKISGRRGQTRVQATRVAFFSVNVAEAAKDPFSYGITEIGTYLHMPIQTYCPLYDHFAHYSVTPELPRGMVLNRGTGCLSGTVETPFYTAVFTLSAVNLLNEAVSTSITIAFKQCIYPNAALSIPLQTTSSAFSVEVTLFSSTWSIIRSSIFFLSRSRQDFFHCLPPGDFFLLLADHSAQGDLTSSFSVQQDGYALQQGVFNPGFPQQWSSIAVRGSISTNHTLWYYSVSGDEPPAQWFAQIDPPKESWPRARLNAIPPMRGAAHYFKTVLDLPSLQAINIVALHLRLRAGVALFINGQEVFRFNLPHGALHAATLATAAFAAPTVYSVHLPVQFSSLKEGRNVLAVETHLAHTPAQPTESYLQVVLQLLSQKNQALIGAEVVDLSAVREGEPRDVGVVHDGIFYNHYFRPSNCRNQSIAFFSANGQPDFASSFSFFTGRSKGAYPHRMALFGRFLGSLEEIERAKKGDPVSSREWMKLCERSDIEYHNVHYGINRHFQFFNKKMFNEYLFVLNDCEKAQGFEIAEIQFERGLVSGFCNTEDLDTPYLHSLKEDYSSYIPSNTWYKVDCSELYRGSIQHFCNSGKWTKTVNQCHCKAPFYFRYPSSVVYISLRQFISIVPKWKGAELHFFTHDILPSGLSLNETTGTIQGEIRDPISMMTLHIACANLEGFLEAELSIVTVNNHEVLLIIIAAVMVTVFFIIIWLITSSMKKKRVESEDIDTSVLHADVLSKELRSFLL